MGNRCSVTYEEIVEANKATTKALKDPKYVCRDDLSKNPSSIKEGFLALAPASASSATHHGREERRRKQVIGSSGGVTRVKLLLTKKEAALLLSKCKVEEGQLKFKLSDHQLQKIRTSNPSSTSPDRRSWNPALQSISEEF